MRHVRQLLAWVARARDSLFNAMFVRSALASRQSTPASAPVAGRRVNPPPVEALTALLTRKVRADPSFKQLVVVSTTLRAGEWDGWDGAGGYALIPEATLRSALAQLKTLATGKSDPRLGLLELQMLRRIAELTAQREDMDRRIAAARERQAAGQGLSVVPPSRVTTELRSRVPSSGFPATEPMAFDERPGRRAVPEMVLMTLLNGDAALREQDPVRGYAVVEVFGAEEAIVDFRDTEPFPHPPPDEQALLPVFRLLPITA